MGKLVANVLLNPDASGPLGEDIVSCRPRCHWEDDGIDNLAPVVVGHWDALKTASKVSVAAFEAEVATTEMSDWYDGLAAFWKGRVRSAFKVV